MYENPEHLFGGRAEMLSLIGSIYETVERPELWPEVLGALNREVGASQSAMIFHKLGAPGAGIGFGLQKTSGLPEETAVAYQGHYHQIDEWFLRGGALTSGWVGSGDEIVERAELQRTEFYNEFLRHHEIEQQMARCWSAAAM